MKILLYELVIFNSKIYLNFHTIDLFYIIYSPNKYLDWQFLKCRSTKTLTKRPPCNRDLQHKPANKKEERKKNDYLNQHFES